MNFSRARPLYQCLDSLILEWVPNFTISKNVKCFLRPVKLCELRAHSWPIDTTAPISPARFTFRFPPLQKWINSASVRDWQLNKQTFSPVSMNVDTKLSKKKVFVYKSFYLFLLWKKYSIYMNHYSIEYSP